MKNATKIKNSTFTIACVAFGFLALAVLSGCTQSNGATAADAQLVTKHRSQFVLTKEPGAVMAILELREKLEGTEATSTNEHDHEGHDHEGHDHDEAGHGEGQHEGHDHDEAGHHEDDHAGHDHPEGDHDHGETGAVAGLGSMENISVVGKISQETTDGGASASDFPWEKGEALFVIVDPSVEGEEEEHQHAEGEECPFCAQKKIEAQALVQFSDDTGTIKVDARQLFDLKVGDIVVVHGDATLQAGVLMIDAEGIYVRR